MVHDPRPTLLLSDYFATRYAAELAKAAPEATIIRHFPDGRFEEAPGRATATYMSSDMWRTRMGRDVLVRLPELEGLRWVHTSSAGVDHPSFGRLLERGVCLTN